MDTNKVDPKESVEKQTNNLTGEREEELEALRSDFTDVKKETLTNVSDNIS
jgi:hypothetical protein